MNNTLLLLLMPVVMLSWGGSWVNGKILVDFTTPEELVFWRFFLTALTFLPVMLWLKESFRFRLPGFLAALAGAALLIIYNELFFTGLRTGLAGAGGVLVTTLVPVLTFLINALITRKNLRLPDYMGLLMGVTGALIILRIWDMDIATLYQSGNIFFLLAALTWAVLTNLSARVRSVMSPMAFSFYLFAFTALLDYVFVLGGELSNPAEFGVLFWSNALMISLFATTFGTSVYFLCTDRLGSAKASSFIFMVPASALFLSWFFIGEPVHMSTVIGGLTAITAVYIINRRQALRR
ncbi:DMT family transporter [Limisalsivibrio acetivorans]|uniref:DMT family transporter n=1 Tax=Limisalsivibrio acetivorans TaxID=1304888 RepID=UPI0003B697D4|nr:DMT family transporter [Limisalsivibrio acetivorans]